MFEYKAVLKLYYRFMRKIYILYSEHLSTDVFNLSVISKINKQLYMRYSIVMIRICDRKFSNWADVIQTWLHEVIFSNLVCGVYAHLCLKEGKNYRKHSSK